MVSTENASDAIRLSTTSGGVDIDAASGINLDTSTGDIDIGTGASAKTITIGNTIGATGIVLNSGTGGIKMTGGVTQPTPVVLADSSTTLTIAANSGRTNVIPDLSVSIAYSIPTPTTSGQYYHFIYGGAAADGQDCIIRTVTTDNSVFFKGSIQWINNTEIVNNGNAVFSNGTSNEELTIATPGYIDVHFLSLSTTTWYIWGTIGSVTTPSFAN